MPFAVVRRAQEPMGFLDLGAEARAERIKRGTQHEPKSPYLPPAKTQELLNRCHVRHHIARSYGGWLEDRYYLWQGNYLDEAGKYIHLGVDFNVPAGTKVYATQKCRVVRVCDDHPLKGGWGPHVVVRFESGEGYLIYGHLSISDLPQLGEKLDETCYVGLVGSPKYNGGWFPHLHVQFMTPEAGKYYLAFGESERLQKKRWEELDGYCNERDLKRAVKEFRDPLPYVA